VSGVHARLAAGALALLLAACASPDPLPMVSTGTATPHLTDAAYIAIDGAELPLKSWLPDGDVKAVVLAVYGINDYSHAFEMPAKIWAQDGIATYAYDQRGFGAAPGPGSWAGEGRLAVDAINAIRVLRRTFPGRPIYLLGESMGGAIAILAATGSMSGVVAGPEGTPRAEADGVILSAPAVWGRPTMDLLPKAALFLAVRLFPDTVLSGRGLGVRISDNDAVLRQMARDPLIIKGTRVDAVYGLVDLMDSALAAAPSLDVPLLLMYGGRDEVVPRRPVAEFVARLPAEPHHPRHLAYYPAGYHLLLRDLGGGIVANDVASWIADPWAPLTSKSDSAAASPWPPLSKDAPEGGAAPQELSGASASPISTVPKAAANRRG